jgi:4-hydroxybenzoate polyprenyltransferase
LVFGHEKRRLLAAFFVSLLSSSILAGWMVSLRQLGLGFICFGMLGLAVVLMRKVLDRKSNRQPIPVSFFLISWFG